LKPCISRSYFSQQLSRNYMSKEAAAAKNRYSQLLAWSKLMKFDTFTFIFGSY